MDFGFLAAVAVRTAIVLGALAVGLRVTGRRQAGELNTHDLLLVLILANAVQNAMTRGDGRLSVALVSSGTLLALGLLFARLQSRHPSWEEWGEGVPTVIVEDGRAVRRNMRREGVTEADLLAAVRDQGVADLAGVKLAVMENNGSISVVPREHPTGG
jgi:uncharacterized membrane protein YcaP (DUF421 family)